MLEATIFKCVQVLYPRSNLDFCVVLHVFDLRWQCLQWRIYGVPALRGTSSSGRLPLSRPHLSSFDESKIRLDLKLD